MLYGIEATKIYSITPTKIYGLSVANFTTVTNTDNDATLTNPYRGVDNDGRTSSPEFEGTLVSCYMSWRDIEASKGTYNFSIVEATYHFTTHRAAGKKMRIIFYMDWPGTAGHIDIPDWLYTEISGDGTVYSNGFAPNYKNATLLSYHTKVIEAIGARYNDDDFIWQFKLGSIGHWGEMHTYAGYLVDTDDGYLPAYEYTKPYYDAYNTYLSNKFCSTRQPRQVNLDYGWGHYNDAYDSETNTDIWLDRIANGYKDWETGSTHPANPDKWKTTPSGGEFWLYPSTQFFSDLVFEETMNQITEGHCTWIMQIAGGEIDDPSEERTNWETLIKSIGYRFYLKSITYPTSLTKETEEDISMTWTNAGLAPFYYDWKVAISLMANDEIVYTETTTFDIRDWVPGDTEESSTITVPSSINTGTYSLMVAILDPDTSEPGIELAMSGGTEELWYIIGDVSII